MAVVFSFSLITLHALDSVPVYSCSIENGVVKECSDPRCPKKLYSSSSSSSSASVTSTSSMELEKQTENRRHKQVEVLLKSGFSRMSESDFYYQKGFLVKVNEDGNVRVWIKDNLRTEILNEQSMEKREFPKIIQYDLSALSALKNDQEQTPIAVALEEGQQTVLHPLKDIAHFPADNHQRIKEFKTYRTPWGEQPSLQMEYGPLFIEVTDFSKGPVEAGTAVSVNTIAVRDLNLMSSEEQGHKRPRLSSDPKDQWVRGNESHSMVQLKEQSKR